MQTNIKLICLSISKTKMGRNLSYIFPTLEINIIDPAYYKINICPCYIHLRYLLCLTVKTC